MAFSWNLIFKEFVFTVEIINHLSVLNDWYYQHQEADNDVFDPHNVHLSAPTSLEESNKIHNNQRQVNNQNSSQSCVVHEFYDGLSTLSEMKRVYLDTKEVTVEQF